MKFIYFLIFLLGTSLAASDKQSLLTNNEVKEVLKCFGDLNLDEGCVICRYMTQKIRKLQLNYR
jgi:hypothetical protein